MFFENGFHLQLNLGSFRNPEVDAAADAQEVEEEPAQEEVVAEEAPADPVPVVEEEKIVELEQPAVVQEEEEKPTRDGSRLVRRQIAENSQSYFHIFNHRKYYAEVI